MRRIVIAVVMALTGTAGTAATAEPVNLLKAEYKPLVDSKDGRVNSCALHFSAVIQTLAGAPLNVQGSVVNTFFRDQLPGLIIKVAAVGASNGNLLRHKVHSGSSFRVGQADTNRMRRSAGADGMSLLMHATVADDMDFVLSFPLHFMDGAWVSLSLDPNRSDYTFRLPAFEQTDAETFHQFDECTTKAMEELKRTAGQ
jgi:hypothetical protein